MFGADFPSVASNISNVPNTVASSCLQTQEINQINKDSGENAQSSPSVTKSDSGACPGAPKKATRRPRLRRQNAIPVLNLPDGDEASASGNLDDIFHSMGIN